MNFLLEHAILVEFVVHFLIFVCEVIFSAFDFGVVFLLFFLKLLPLVAQHLHPSLFSRCQLCQLVAFSFDDHFLHGQCLFCLAFSGSVFIVKLFVFAIVANSYEFVCVFHLPFLSHVLHAY